MIYDADDAKYIFRLHDQVRDLKAEIERLRVLVRHAMPFVNDAGDDEDPEAKAEACGWLEDARRALEEKE